jgi:phosphoribosylanthranilate isomerase
VTWIKICGTTSLEDALLAVEAGADALGFIFVESPRRIEPRRVREIISKLPDSVEKVGVFVDASLEYVRDVAAQTGITCAQLQGREDLEFVRNLKTAIPALRVIKTVRADHLADALSAFLDPAVMDRILIDSGSAKQPGGTGKVFDWQAARKAMTGSASAQDFHWIVAGGLAPENVGEAIRLFHPWGVDVASGVESVPGKKDPDKLERFVAAVRAAEVKP